MDLLQSLITAGAVATISGLLVTLVRIAIGAERRRADDWRQAAQTSAKANEVLSSNVEKLVNTVEQMARSQNDMMALLQGLAAERRAAS